MVCFFLCADLPASDSNIQVGQANNNLVKNYNLESTSPDNIATHWSYNKNYTNLVNDKLHVNNKCLEVRTDNVLQQAKAGEEISSITINYIEEITIKGDCLYKISFDSYVPLYGKGYPVIMYVKWFDKSGHPVTDKSDSIQAARMEDAKWVTTCGFIASPRNAVTARIYFVIRALRTVAYIDNAFFGLSSDITNPSLSKRYKPLKIMYCSDATDRLEETKRIKESNFTISYLYWKCYKEERWHSLEHNLKLAKKIDLPIFIAVWLSEVSPPSFRIKHPLIDFNGNEYKKTPSIFHEEWWDIWFTPTIMKLVSKSQKYNIKGILIDFELYDTPNRIEDVCYCNFCLNKFSNLNNIAIQGKVTAEKARWLLNHGFLSSYRKFQEEFLAHKLSKLRCEIDAINPNIQFGNLPYYDFLVDRVFTRILGTEDAPFIIALEKTYGLQSEFFSDTVGTDLAAGYILSVKNMLRERGYNCCVIGGISPWTSMDFMEKKINKILQVGDGYWFFSRKFIDYELHPSYFDNKQRFTREQADRVWDVLKNINIDKRREISR